MTDTSNILVTATHGLILLTTIVAAVSSYLNRKKLNKIEVIINGGLVEKIKSAIQEAKDQP